MMKENEVEIGNILAYFKDKHNIAFRSAVFLKLQEKRSAVAAP